MVSRKDKQKMLDFTQEAFRQANFGVQVLDDYVLEVSFPQEISPESRAYAETMFGDKAPRAYVILHPYQRTIAEFNRLLGSARQSGIPVGNIFYEDGKTFGCHLPKEIQDAKITRSLKEYSPEEVASMYNLLDIEKAVRDRSFPSETDNFPQVACYRPELENLGPESIRLVSLKPVFSNYEHEVTPKCKIELPANARLDDLVLPKETGRILSPDTLESLRHLGDAVHAKYPVSTGLNFMYNRQGLRFIPYQMSEEEILQDLRNGKMN